MKKNNKKLKPKTDEHSSGHQAPQAPQLPETEL
jgi:hypothetical protein